MRTFVRANPEAKQMLKRMKDLDEQLSHWLAVRVRGSRCALAATEGTYLTGSPCACARWAISLLLRLVRCSPQARLGA
jgi:hypothetical protein